MEDKGKDLLTSKTTWGALASAGALIANSFGVPLSADMILGVIGFGLTLWGRFTAEKPIKRVAGVNVK